MNTPSHAIINLALLGRKAAPENNLLIVIGGLLPDIPIFLFYAWAKLVARLPESRIWSEAYYYPIVQDTVALFHSIPLVILGWGVAVYFKQSWLQLFCLSLLLHDLLDLPVHNDDAHRHFFPFSDYRFISPISYWDRNHHASVVAFVEWMFVLLATVRNFGLVQSMIGKGLMILVNIVYGLGYFVFFRFLSD
ncbi:MAG: hypothetical protein ACFBSC_00250 [Microcoleaceae cyanobacterium]